MYHSSVTCCSYPLYVCRPTTLMGKNTRKMKYKIKNCQIISLLHLEWTFFYFNFRGCAKHSSELYYSVRIPLWRKHIRFNSRLLLNVIIYIITYSYLRSQWIRQFYYYGYARLIFCAFYHMLRSFYCILAYVCTSAFGCTIIFL